jgi:DNA-binding NarL/FixJ family response regulator
VRVIVADDSLLARAGIASLLTEAGCDVVAQVDDAPGAISAVEAHAPDVAVLDIRMPPTHTTEGLDAAAEIRSRFPQVAVLVLSHHVEPTYALQLMDTYPERVGYLLKERVVTATMLVDTLGRLADGECVIDPTIVTRLMRRRRRVDPLDQLTEREREVLDLVAQGHSNAGIARLLGITDRTVEAHASQIFAKLGVMEERDMNRRVLAVLAFLNRAE